MADGRKTYQFDLGPQSVSPIELEPSIVDGEVLQTSGGNVIWSSLPPAPADFEKAKRYAFFVS